MGTRKPFTGSCHSSSRSTCAGVFCLKQESACIVASRQNSRLPDHFPVSSGHRIPLYPLSPPSVHSIPHRRDRCFRRSPSRLTQTRESLFTTRTHSFSPLVASLPVHVSRQHPRVSRILRRRTAALQRMASSSTRNTRTVEGSE